MEAHFGEFEMILLGKPEPHSNPCKFAGTVPAAPEAFREAKNDFYLACESGEILLSQGGGWVYPVQGKVNLVLGMV